MSDTVKYLLVGTAAAIGIVLVARKFFPAQPTPFQQLVTGFTDIAGAIKGTGKPGTTTGSAKTTTTGTGSAMIGSSPVGPMGDSPFAAYPMVTSDSSAIANAYDINRARLGGQPTQFTSFEARATAGALRTSPYRISAATARN